MKKYILVFVISVFGMQIQAQDLISGGTNSWIFHTPDNGSTNLHLAPKINGNWDWLSQTIFFGNGNVRFSKNVGIGGIDPNVSLEVLEEIRVRLNTYLPDKNVARITALGFSNTTGAQNWSLRGVYQYANGVNNNSIGGDLDLIKSLDGNTILGTKTDGTPLGYVGLGTVNPDEMLTVKGNIHTEEVRVDLNVPPDYVFQKYFTGTSTLKEDYKMLTLEEVESFAKKNHHLPEIPSANQIKNEGLKLKQMTALLLQKIEELTLYTIEQEKRIKMLEKKLLRK